jgi:hypothetical protein
VTNIREAKRRRNEAFFTQFIRDFIQMTKLVLLLIVGGTDQTQDVSTFSQQRHCEIRYLTNYLRR